MFISSLEVLKQELSVLKGDNPSSCHRINQQVAIHLLEEIEQLENEKKKLKEKLEQINRLSNSDI